MFKLIYNFIRLFYYPIFNWFLPLVSKKVKERIQFEKQNINYRSFKTQNITADYAFEISSEGELEQIRPLLDKMLSENKRIELIYCSESVDHKCQQIYKQANGLVKILRMPLITYNPFITYQCPYKWLTAKTFFLCRYDFFPELVIYGNKKDVSFNLLWGTLKNSEKGFINSLYQSYVYKSFNRIVAATKLDQQLFTERFHLNFENVDCYDFRPWQIINRQMYASSTLKERFPFFDLFLELIDKTPREKRILFGSFWDNELLALNNNAINMLEQGYLISIVCHKLNLDNLMKIQSELELKYQLKVYTIDENISKEQMQLLLESYTNKPGIIMINLKGILCELYSQFGLAFVGGGHGVSVHSLMEPFLANSIVFSGPKVHRSTEYDLIFESHPDRLHIVEKLSEFFPLITKYESLHYSNIDNFKQYYQKNFDHIIKWLNAK